MFRTRIWLVFSIFALLAVYWVLPYAIAADKTVSELTDKELVETMFDALRADQSVEANRLKMEELQAEFDRRTQYGGMGHDDLADMWIAKVSGWKSREPVLPAMTPQELWPILIERPEPDRPNESAQRPIEALRQLKERYDAATPGERTTLKQGFIDYAMSLPLSADWRDRSDEAHRQSMDYSSFVHASTKIFPEMVALGMCKALLLDRHLPHCMDDYAYIIAHWPGEPHGAEFAAEMGRFYDSLGADYPREILSEKAGAAQSVISALGGCGDAGLDELVRIGVADSPMGGYEVVGVIGTARARDMLLNAYEGNPQASFEILHAFCRKLYAQDEEIKTLVRRDLPQYLSPPEEDFYISSIMKAVGLAGSLHDPYFLPMLRDLRTQVAEQGVANCEESKQLPPDVVSPIVPDIITHMADVLMRDLDETIAELEKEEAKAKAASTP